MKLTVERATLLKAMSLAQSAVERRNTIPILSNVLIDAEGTSITLKATDLDLEMVQVIPANVEREGAVTVPAHLLHEIIRKLPDGADIVCYLDPGAAQLELVSGKSRFFLATLPREDFPQMASEDFDRRFVVGAAVLRRLFERAKFAISSEETRYYLNGVYLHAADEAGRSSLRAVATDGHRLARIDAPLPEGARGMAGVIVPRKTVGELRKLLEDDTAEVTVSVSTTKIRFECNDVTLTSKVIDGTFPDYARVIPSGNKRVMEVDARLFAAAVDRVSTVCAERTRAVKLTIDEDRLELSVNSPDSGSAREDLVVAYAAEPLEVGFNAKYLLEILDQITGDNAVFRFADPTQPALVTETNDDSALFVVMPMRV